MSSPVKVFLVSQGANYEIEKEGGFIWAPQKAKNDKPPMFYWETLKEIDAGDILLHCLQGNIVAVSEAMAQITENGWQGHSTAPMPENFTTNRQEVEGWLVKCEYVELNEWLPLGVLREIIIKYKRDKHSAFDKNGDVNAGYCYILENEIANSIIEEMFHQQPSLRQLDYLTAFLDS